MARHSRHKEHHRTARVGWLRAAVLGANDGIVSTAALIVGVAAAGTEPRTILLSGLAGLLAGAMSMAAGEYVSVHTQADAENADLKKERAELREAPEAELRELATIYVGRGLDPALAKQVAEQLTAHDALAAHARDELGITESQAPRPIQAALSSAASFTVGAALPLLLVPLIPVERLVPVVSVTTLALLASLGALAARAGGANLLKGILRVTFWGALALAATITMGTLFHSIT
ncbi:MAG TPA: VIT family protein [Steroidobacteraceae bacterium]|nr:VIT family protein [Steroidobacteraceae bacterium]